MTTKNPPTEQTSQAVVSFFKSLADERRLRIVGLLAEEPRCGRELATEIGVSPANITHHMRLLKSAGLVRERREKPYTIYSLDLSRLQKTLKSLAKREAVKQFALPEDLPQRERKVIETFFDGDKLKAIPAQRRKKEIVFEEILRRLPRRKTYPEKDLSEMLKAFHSDFCTIRREFIMGRYMTREAGVYELTDRGRAVLQ